MYSEIKEHIDFKDFKHIKQNKELVLDKDQKTRLTRCTPCY